MENLLGLLVAIGILAGTIELVLQNRKKDKVKLDPLTEHQQRIADKEARKLKRALRRKERQYKRYVRRQKREGK